MWSIRMVGQLVEAVPDRSVSPRSIGYSTFNVYPIVCVGDLCGNPVRGASHRLGLGVCNRELISDEAPSQP